MLYSSPFLSGYPVFHQPGCPFSLLPIENPGCLADHPKPTYTFLIYLKPFSGLLLLHTVWLMIFVPIYMLLYFIEIDVIYYGNVLWKVKFTFQISKFTLEMYYGNLLWKAWSFPNNPDQISQHSSLLLFMTSFSNLQTLSVLDCTGCTGFSKVLQR